MLRSCATSMGSPSILLRPPTMAAKWKMSLEPRDVQAMLFHEIFRVWFNSRSTSRRSACRKSTLSSPYTAIPPVPPSHFKVPRCPGGAHAEVVDEQDAIGGGIEEPLDHVAARQPQPPVTRCVAMRCKDGTSGLQPSTSP